MTDDSSRGAGRTSDSPARGGGVRHSTSLVTLVVPLREPVFVCWYVGGLFDHFHLKRAAGWRNWIFV